MIGGGEGAFIGAVHRIAARLDDRYEFVAGALSATPDKARRSGAALGLAPERSYADFATMLAAEAARPDGIEAVAIVTPNHLHAPAALACLQAGLHVICDKPLTTTLALALELRAAATASDRVFAVTYNYSGYPMVRHARAMIAAGELGEIRLVQVQYAQDWLTEPLEATGQKQADWRTDPARSGAGGCIGDIGTHAYQLAHFVTGMRAAIAARRSFDLRAGPPRRRQRAGAAALCERRARRAVGEPGRARQREQSDAARVRHERRHRVARRSIRTSSPGRRSANRPAWSRAARNAANSSGARVTRIPAGHPEGYLEAFATIYAEVAAAIMARRSGGAPDAAVLFPGIDDGVAGVAFVDAAIRSSRAGGVWTPLS